MQALGNSELETLKMEANGLCVKEIARRRGLSYWTIHCQLERAKEKLGARSTTHAVAILATRGILAADDVEVLV